MLRSSASCIPPKHVDFNNFLKGFYDLGIKRKVRGYKIIVIYVTDSVGG